MKKVMIFLTLLCALTACQDMNLMPKDNISDPSFWKSPEDFEIACNYLYNSAFEEFPTDVDSDISYALNTNEYSNGSWIAPDEDDEWDKNYVTIRSANLILEQASNYPGEAGAIKRYLAEARFFRAYAYWRLYRKFNNVPLVTHVLNVDSEELKAKRNSQSEVEDFILNELEDIVPDLPLHLSLPDKELGRITQGSALSLKARVALYSGTWAKYHGHRPDGSQLLEQAIIASQKVMDSRQYSLFTGKGAQSYRYLFIEMGDDSPEDILSSRYYNSIRTHNTSSLYAWGYGGSPTRVLADMYLCTDGLPIIQSKVFRNYQSIESEFENRDPRMKQTFLVPGTIYTDFEPGKEPQACSADFSTRPETRTGYKLWKFIGEQKGGDTQAEYDNHLIRYAEVLLIYAEATFEKNGHITNAELDRSINVIRDREGVQMPHLTVEFAQENGLDMLTEIRRERTVELAFEGFRRDDLRRWKEAEKLLPEDIKGIKYKGTEYETIGVLNTGNPGTVDANGFLIIEQGKDRQFEVPKHYYYSLPLKQLFLNPNLVPNNPGW